MDHHREMTEPELKRGQCGNDIVMVDNAPVRVRNNDDQKTK